MFKSRLRTSYILTIIIAILAMIASAGGLFIDGLYRDNALITSAWHGNDFVTLVIVLPLMVTSLILAMRGSQKAQLVWIGTLGYMLYNYIFYLYGAAFNRFFLIYVLLFTLSMYALVFAMTKIDAMAVSQAFRVVTPVKWISGFMMFFAVFLGVLWIAMSLSFVFTGQVPQPILQTDHPTGVVFATDLSLLIPALILGSTLLWKRLPWGFVLASIVLIKASTYGLAMIAMSVFTYVELGTVDSLLPLWVVLSLGCFISCGLLLGNMKSLPFHLALSKDGK